MIIKIKRTERDITDFGNTTNKGEIIDYERRDFQFTLVAEIARYCTIQRKFTIFQR